MKRIWLILLIVIVNYGCISERAACNAERDSDNPIADPYCLFLMALPGMIEEYRINGDIANLEDAKNAEKKLIYLCMEEIKKYEKCQKKSDVIPDGLSPNSW